MFVLLLLHMSSLPIATNSTLKVKAKNSLEHEITFEWCMAFSNFHS